MSLDHTLEPIPEVKTRLSEQGEAFALGFVLIAGLTLVTPILSVVLSVPALISVALVGLLYGVVALLLRQVLAGLLVGFVVTAGFAADVPLASIEYLNSVTGALGPELLLSQIPLLILFILVVSTESHELIRERTLAETLFAAFVGWSVLAALFGATARTDVALFFSLLMAQLLVVIVLLRYTIQQGILQFQTVVQIFTGTVFAQSLFAIAQFINGGTFGISTLGESGEETISTFSFGPLGTLSTGTFVSGFTGGQFILASLIILAVPILLAASIRSNGWLRVASLGGILTMILVLRATAGDAARGGLLVAGALFMVFTGYLYRTMLRNRIQYVLSEGTAEINVLFGKNTLLSGAASLFSLVLILYPSSESGASSVVTNVENGGETTIPAASSAQSTTTAANDAGETTPQQVDYVGSLLENLSLPFFSLHNLGTRVQQYISGLDIFVQHPLFGIGGGNFRYYATEYGVSQPLPLHNIYIALLAETGLPGFLLYVGAVILTIWYGGRVVAEHDRKSILLVGVLCGLVGYLSFGLFDVLQLIKPTSVFSFGLLSGAVLGKYREEKQ